MYRITLKNGETHICQDAEVWEKLNAHWVDKSSPTIAKVEHVPDTEPAEPNPNEDIDSVTEKLSRQDFRSARGELYRLLRELKELRAKATPEPTPYNVGDTVKLKRLGLCGTITEVDTSAKPYRYYVVTRRANHAILWRLADELEFDA